ncbi:hypothetical protein DRO02_08070, partial [archaeon]
MVLVRVHRVSSIRDPESGRYGKMIELVEEARLRPAARISGMPQEFLMVQSMVQDLRRYLQSMGLMFGSAIKPK